MERRERGEKERRGERESLIMLGRRNRERNKNNRERGETVRER
jgi:hypothetical protein